MNHIDTPVTAEVLEIIVESAEAAGHDVGPVVAFLAASGLGLLAYRVTNGELKTLSRDWYLQVCRENSLDPRGLRTGIHIAVPII